MGIGDLPPVERVVYTVEVGGLGGLPIATYSDVGGVKLVPSDPPILVLNDRNGNHKGMVTICPGYKIDFTITETLRPVDLTIPGTLINHDFSKTH